jgi:asparagine synthase (glutamine-hydrolysing)
MSGILGIFHLDQSPVDRRLLQELTNFQSFRGPDAQRVWLDGHIGFGHALLKTTDDPPLEHQPLSLDGDTWIVADARVDGQRDLITKLQARGSGDLRSASDAELILRAYGVWQEDCVEHLLGDFAFGIWDRSRQKLFCARDQMGVKPFYYCYLGSTVVFSNTLDCIRQHPSVSNALNDQAIADFLLFEGNQDHATTCFADIQRLPPAHRATWSHGRLRLSRYWSLPIDEPLLYKRAEDYVDRFRELLAEAVGDRLRTSRVAVFMSGGLDSPTLAATARDLLREQSANFDLRAFSRTDSQAPVEQYCAGLVADRLKIPIHYHEWSANPNWEQTSLRNPEPSPAPWQMQAYKNYCRQIESYSRVFLYGEGPDNALRFEWQPYLSYLARHRRYFRLFRDACSTLISQRRPPFWCRIERRTKELLTGHQPEPSFPDWLTSSLESRLQLRARWEKFLSPTPSIHPVRPEAYASFSIPLWQAMFECHDSAWTTAPFEVRYPFVDLRMLRFLLAVPPLPWCRSKHLIRRAMRGVLPKPVLRRTKSGVPCATIMDRVGRFGLTPFVPAQGLSGYVNAERVPNLISANMWIFGGHLRVRSLNHWLQYSCKKAQYRHREESANEAVPK